MLIEFPAIGANTSRKQLLTISQSLAANMGRGFIPQRSWDAFLHADNDAARGSVRRRAIAGRDRASPAERAKSATVVRAQQYFARAEHVRPAGPHHAGQPALSRNVCAISRVREAGLHACAIVAIPQRYRLVRWRRQNLYRQDPGRYGAGQEHVALR